MTHIAQHFLAILLALGLLVSEKALYAGDSFVNGLPEVQADEQLEKPTGLQWHSVVQQSLFFLLVQHSYRIGTEDSTVRDLRGPFFKDYWQSVKGIGGWDDGDEFYVNYVGHPLEGAVAGYIAIQNDPPYRQVQFGDHGYWRSRVRATCFAALYSAMFEIGPVSEASLGNVGEDPTRAGLVDFVVTPLGGLGVMVLEDSIDRYIIRRLERWNPNPVLAAFYRTMLNPSRTFANMMALKPPWYRDRTYDAGARRR